MPRWVAAVLSATALAALIAFGYLMRQMSAITAGLAAHEEIRAALRTSLGDQKQLARLDPANRDRYRTRFEQFRTLQQRLDVVHMTGVQMTRTLVYALTSLVAVAMAMAVGSYFIVRRDREQRLARIRSALAELSTGRSGITLDDHRRDSIGTIASMIEETSRVIAGDRKTIQYLEHLSAWQEAARRHAHEIRTPLTAARMEIEDVIARATVLAPLAEDEFARRRRSIIEELDRLRDFTTQYTSFARVGKPSLARMDLRSFVSDFCIVFRNAWPNLTLVSPNGSSPCLVAADGEMLRQVLVNLCSNSSLALGKTAGAVTFSISAHRGQVCLDVADDGPGVDAAIVSRLFQPYVTTRTIGEGMGLGLAISKRILLDHGGDLQLIDSAAGARFRLTLPAAANEHA